PIAEEAAIVRFQTIRELSDAPEEVVIDYVPVGLTEGGERRALVLVLRVEMLQTYQALCKAAGLKLAALAPRTVGLTACLQHLVAKLPPAPAPEPADAAVALLTVAERWAEFCILREGNLLLSRPVTVGPTLAGEVRRNLAVYQGQSPQQPVRAVYIT